MNCIYPSQHWIKAGSLLFIKERHPCSSMSYCPQNRSSNSPLRAHKVWFLHLLFTAWHCTVESPLQTTVRKEASTHVLNLELQETGTTAVKAADTRVSFRCCASRAVQAHGSKIRLLSGVLLWKEKAQHG